MNETEARQRFAEILGKLYWHRNGRFPLEGGDAEYEALTTEMQVIQKGLANGRYPPELNENGATVHRTWMSMNRYAFDFNLKDGWQQYDTDQDAWYFGVWVNLKALQILTYAEGDVVLTTAPTVEIMAKGLDEMESFYHDGVVAVVADGFDSNGGLENPTAILGTRAKRDDLYQLYDSPVDTAKDEPLSLKAIFELIKQND